MARESMGLLQGTVDVLILKTLSWKTAPRLRHLRGHSRTQQRRPRRRGRRPLSGAPPARAERTRRIRVGNLGHQPARALLLDQHRRPEAVAHRSGRAAPIRQRAVQHFGARVADARCHARFDCRSAHARESPPRSTRNLPFTSRPWRRGSSARGGRPTRPTPKRDAGSEISNSRNTIAAPRTFGARERNVA